MMLGVPQDEIGGGTRNEGTALEIPDGARCVLGHGEPRLGTGESHLGAGERHHERGAVGVGTAGIAVGAKGHPNASLDQAPGIGPGQAQGQGGTRQQVGNGAAVGQALDVVRRKQL